LLATPLPSRDEAFSFRGGVLPNCSRKPSLSLGVAEDMYRWSLRAPIWMVCLASYIHRRLLFVRTNCRLITLTGLHPAIGFFFPSRSSGACFVASSSPVSSFAFQHNQLRLSGDLTLLAQPQDLRFLAAAAIPKGLGDLLQTTLQWLPDSAQLVERTGQCLNDLYQFFGIVFLRGFFCENSPFCILGTNAPH